MKFLCVLLILLCGISSSIAEERILGKQGQFEAIAESSFSCTNPSVIIRGASEKAFTGSKTELQKFIGLLRAAIGFECPKLQRIFITGQVNGKTIYSGHTQASNKWRLEGTNTSRQASSGTNNPYKVSSGQPSPRTPNSSNVMLSQGKPSSTTSSPGLDIWRFKLKCGREVIKGFIDLKLSSGSASATFESFSRYPNLGFLKSAGTYNQSTRVLDLKSAGFIKGKPQMSPVDIAAKISADGYSMTGKAAGAANCQEFTAWKTKLDSRRNSNGIIPRRFKSFLTKNNYAQAAKNLSIADCEQYVAWYSKSVPLKTPDGPVASAFVDPEEMLSVLGFTYDGMKADDAKPFSLVDRNCAGILRQSADTRHRQILAKFDKSRKQSSTSSPFEARHGGKYKKVGANKRLNYYWYQNMYLVTSVRDARLALNRLTKDINSISNDMAGLRQIEQQMKLAQSKDGLLAYLPQSDRDTYLKSLKTKQIEISAKAVNDELNAINWESFASNVQGIKQLKQKHKETKVSVGRSLSDSALKQLDREFETKHKALSSEVTDEILESLPKIGQSLESLRGYWKTRDGYVKKYSQVLVAADIQRITTKLDSSFYDSASNTSQISAWLNQQVSQDEKGLDVLDGISQDIFKKNVEELGNSNYNNKLRSLAQALLARYNEIKTEECIVPDGFEEMKDVICPDA